MSTTEPTVFIVEDDDAMRDALQVLVRSVGMRTYAYAAAEEFLARFVSEQAGCLLLDVRMPGIDGLELQRQLAAREVNIPIIFLTGHGDVPMAVQAMQQGAVDFITKPFREQALLDSIKRAVERDAHRRRRQAECAGINSRLASLTTREREVLDLVVAGRHNKAIAAKLGLSHKTIEFHRKRIMAKMQAESSMHLLRMVLKADGIWGRP